MDDLLHFPPRRPCCLLKFLEPGFGGELYLAGLPPWLPPMLSQGDLAISPQPPFLSWLQTPLYQVLNSILWLFCIMTKYTVCFHCILIHLLTNGRNINIRKKWRSVRRNRQKGRTGLAFLGNFSQARIMAETGPRSVRAFPHSNCEQQSN